MAEEIRTRIRQEVGITASAGVGPNKFIAKIASDWNKPDGLHVVRPQDADAFVAALPVGKLHGVGRVTAARVFHFSGQKKTDSSMTYRKERPVGELPSGMDEYSIWETDLQKLAAVRAAGVTIKDIATEDPDLEDVFLAMTYGDTSRPDPTQD
mgnify:CR=1 FL=1